MLADEGRLIASKSDRLKRHLEFARRAFRFWMERAENRRFAESSTDHDAKYAAALLSVQFCRQFYSVIGLCSRCEAHDATLVTRALYESTLALLFVLKPFVRLTVCEKKDGTGKGTGHFYARKVTRKTPRPQRDRLSRARRARIYLASSVLQDDRIGGDMQDCPGLRRQGKRLRLTDAEKQAIKTYVGKRWYHVLTNSRYYSGVNVEALTYALTSKKSKLHRWYESLYRIYSTVAHGAAAKRMMNLQQPEYGLRASWHSDPDDAANVLGIATGLFLFCAGLMQQEIGFGAAMENGDRRAVSRA